MAYAKILLLTVSHGSAHRRAAEAMRQALLDIQPGLTVEIADALKHCAWWFRAYYDSYELPLKYCPSLWGFIENLQRQASSTGPVWLYRKGAKLLFRFIREFDPDVVIATEVGTGEIAAMLKREEKARFSLVGLVLMDFNRAWVQPEFDLYPTAPDDLAAELESAGVPRPKLLPCGIPIDPIFARLEDRQTVRARLGIEPDAPLVLVLFGGTGFGNPRRIVKEISKLRQKSDVVFITGRNRQLEEETRELCKDFERFRALGWVENIHDWMVSADLLVSKPGGVTLTEAFACGLPMLAFDPLPGNERRTAARIDKWGVGRWVKRPEDLAPAIERLLDSPEELDRMRRAALSRARPYAARDAALGILKLVEEKSQTRTRSG